MSLEAALLKAAESAAQIERTIQDGREGWRDANAQLMTLSTSLGALRTELRGYRDEMNLRDAAHVERHEKLVALIESRGGSRD